MSFRVLVVEDDPDMLETLGRLLGRFGYKCLTATSGPEGIDAIEIESPDLVVTDLHLPGTDGVAVMRSARAHVPAIPVVLMSAYPTLKSQGLARQDRALVHLAKPFTNTNFLAAVQHALAAGSSSTG